MTDKLTSFLTRHHACTEGLSRLAATGAATPEEAWARADARDLVWAVTCPGVMSSDQRRRFLAEAVLTPIEHLLTDERSKNILQKLRTNEHITQEDKDAAQAAARADAAASYAAADAALWASYAAAAERAASWAAAEAADAYASWAAAAAASDASYSASWAAASWAAAAAAAYAASWAAASWAAAEAAADAASWASWASWAAAREAQARWIRENIKLSDLHIN